MNISVWEKESFYGDCDVLVAGAGLLGLWTARELKIQSPALKITLIDRSPVPCGASTRNAGFACFGSPSEMIHDLEVMGEDAMWRIVEMRYCGIKKILQTFTAVQTGYEPLGGFECYTPGQFDKDLLPEKIAAINKGMHSITGDSHSFTDATGKLQEYGMQGFETMMENRFEGGIHSGRYVESLTAYVKQSGVRILNGVEMTGCEKAGSGFEITTDQPVKIRARQVLLATNAWLYRQAPELQIVPARGQIIVSPPIEKLALQGTFHFDGGYYYFRNMGNRLLIGGARNSDFAAEETLELDTTAFIRHKLYGFLQQHIPAAAAFAQEEFESWSGLMAMHPTKRPVLEKTAAGAWAAMCCNGMGVALSPVFAEEVATAIINEIK